jgi:hypothetical protein
MELVAGGIAELDLVLDASQECDFHRSAWVEIGGKDNEKVKWNLDLPSSCKSEKVDPML